MIEKIVSGGQTGADRAALDWAIWHEIPHGGWCPKGRKALDGPLEPRYQLIETPRSDYLQRTEWNVRDSDGTVILSLAQNLTGGSKRTADFAEKHGKPWLHIAGGLPYNPEETLAAFIAKHAIRVLNVAGSRESKEPGIYRFTKGVLERTFFPTSQSLLAGPGED